MNVSFQAYVWSIPHRPDLALVKSGMVPANQISFTTRLGPRPPSSHSSVNIYNIHRESLGWELNRPDGYSIGYLK